MRVNKAPGKRPSTHKNFHPYWYPHWEWSAVLEYWSWHLQTGSERWRNNYRGTRKWLNNMKVSQEEYWHVWRGKKVLQPEAKWGGCHQGSSTKSSGPEWIFCHTKMDSSHSRRSCHWVQSTEASYRREDMRGGERAKELLAQMKVNEELDDEQMLTKNGQWLSAAICKQERKCLEESEGGEDFNFTTVDQESYSDDLSNEPEMGKGVSDQVHWCYFKFADQPKLFPEEK